MRNPCRGLGAQAKNIITTGIHPKNRGGTCTQNCFGTVNAYGFIDGVCT